MFHAKSNPAPERRPYRKRRLRRSVRALLGARTKDTTIARERNGRYYSHVYISRELYQTISLLAQVNRCSKMFVTDQAVRVGLSKLLSESIRESNRQGADLQEHGFPAKPTPLVRELARWARSQGFEVGKHI